MTQKTEQESASLCKTAELGIDQKNKGNSHYKQNDLKTAKECYLQAIEVQEVCKSSEHPDVQKDWVASLLNLSCICSKDGDFANGVTYADRVIKKLPRNVKAYYRRAQANHGLKFYKDCVLDYERIIKIEPKNQDAQKALTEVNDVQKNLENTDKTDISEAVQIAPKTEITDDKNLSILRILANENFQRVQYFLTLVIEGQDRDTKGSSGLNNLLKEELEGLMFPPTNIQAIFEQKNRLHIENKYFQADIRIEVENFDSYQNLIDPCEKLKNFDGFICLVTKNELADKNQQGLLKAIGDSQDEKVMSQLFIDDPEKEIDLESFYDNCESYIESTSDSIENFQWSESISTTEPKNKFEDKEGFNRVIECLKNTTWRNYENVKSGGDDKVKQVIAEEDLGEDVKDLLDIGKGQEDQKGQKGQVENDKEEEEIDEENFEKENAVFEKLMGEMMMFKHKSGNLGYEERRDMASEMMMKLCGLETKL